MQTNRYLKVIKNHEVKPNYLKNGLVAFFFGGFVCLVGQGIFWLYVTHFATPPAVASTYMIVTMVFIAAILTGLGIYDKFGQIAKAGAFIPITGFANSLTSAALEGKSEGLVLGIATNMFKLAGAVIVVAIMSGFVFGLIRYFLVSIEVAPALDHTVSLVMEVA